jgi:hypothetical protein
MPTLPPPAASFASRASSSTAGPIVSTVPPVIYVGDNFVVQGSGFTPGSVVNFFVATAAGTLNFGPLVPTGILPGQLMAFVPITVDQGEGVASIQVVDTDESHIASNSVVTLLQGDPASGLPSVFGINGAGLAASSYDPDVAVANVETVVTASGPVVLAGSGFDTVNGVGVDLFCDCPDGKAQTAFLLPGDPGLSSGYLTFPLQSSGAGTPIIGPGAFQVTNLGDGFKSAAVAAPIGERIAVTGVAVNAGSITVTGTGFSALTVINLFNLQTAGGVVNLGGLNPDGTPKIPLTLISNHQFVFTLPAAAVAGPAFVQALNPPFIPFTGSGDDPGGAFVIQ